MFTSFIRISVAAFLIMFGLSACSDDGGTSAPAAVIIDEGPKDSDHDFYVGMSYTHEPAANAGEKNFYVIMACTDSGQQLESASLNVQGLDVDLQHKNYDDQDFYIGYIDLEPVSQFDFIVNFNGNESIISVPRPSELEVELPVELTPNQDLSLSWTMDEDPQVIYVEGFQRARFGELLNKGVEYLKPDSRQFNMPAAWLWSNDGTQIRELQIGIMNYKIVNRVCINISDGAYRAYENASTPG